MLKIRKAKPIGSQVIVTKNVYDWDEFDGSVIMHQRGDLKFHQKVLAVGDDVRFVKPGDIVEINFYKYAVLKEDPNSLKATDDNKAVEFRLNSIDMVDERGNKVTNIIIDQRDVQFVVEDYDEVQCDATINTEQPNQIILPNQNFRV